MRQIRTIKEYNELYETLSKPIALVPTMGYLHKGHLSLVKEARKNCAYLVVSIFVNPTQFAPGEDLDKYPKDLKKDIALLKKEGVDFVFTPTSSEMYAGDFDTWVNVHGVTKTLEGAKRPTHFKGVATVVAKLFNIIKPQIAYFGQKDAQQAVVIKKMVKDLSYGIDIEVLPIVRDADGLALSSRNKYLSAKERKAAVILYKSLFLAENLFQEGVKESKIIIEKMTKLISEEPLARIDYISINDAATLKDVENIKDKALVSLAVYFGDTRLIDNIVLG